MFKSFIISFLSIVFALNSTIVQALDLSQFELKASYALTSDGVDETGNFEDMQLVNPIFEDGGVFSWGCWSSGAKDSCLIATPQLNVLNDIAFAIQLDFKLSTFGLPIFQAGNSYRYLGIQSTTSGGLILKTGSQAEEEVPEFIFNIDEWYTATVIHNTHDSTTTVYINDELVFTKKKYLNHPNNDNIISNTDFSRGKAFFGYIKNLNIYSTDEILSIDDQYIDDQNILIYPNPASSSINIHVETSQPIDYSISNSVGIEVLFGRISESKQSIDIQELPVGIYVLMIENRSYKFIKD